MEAHMKEMIGKLHRLLAMYSHFESPLLTPLVRLGALKVAYCSYDVRKDKHNYRLLGRPLAGDHRMLREVLLNESYAPILEALPNKPLRVLDIGAHIGSFTAWLNGQTRIREAYCFEPNPESFNLCRFNLAQFTNVEVIMAGVGGASRQTEMLIDPAAQERASILKDMGRPGNVKSIPVTVLSLADWLSDHPGEFDLVKMDCEGAEWEILRMCPEVFSRFSTLVAEIHHDPVDRKTKADFSQAMQGYGFEVIANDHLFFGTRTRNQVNAMTDTARPTALDKK
jgi:FkbM family methyltransferase